MNTQDLMYMLNKNKTSQNNLGGTAYINVEKLKQAGSTGNFVEDALVGEALHNLKNSMPTEYDKLFQAAISDPDVIKIARIPYERTNPKVKSTGEKQPFIDWLKESWFDQLVGGYLLGGEKANIGTLKNREWNKESKVYGTTFKKELENFSKNFEKNKPIILENIKRATPEQEKKFFETHPMYGEFQPNIVDLMKALNTPQKNDEMLGLLK